jgi:hypothetical protein
MPLRETEVEDAAQLGRLLTLANAVAIHQIAYALGDCEGIRG